MIKKEEVISKPHHDENLVPEYDLPDPLLFNNGTAVEAKNWPERRTEILELFRENIYGDQPNIELESRVNVIREVPIKGIKGGVRRDLVVIFGDNKHSIFISLYLPAPKYWPVPTFIGLNFHGNHTVHFDDTIDIPDYFVGDRPDLGSHGNNASSNSRGMHASCWPIEMILSHGFALATAHYYEIAPDDTDHYEQGVQRLEKSKTNQIQSRAIATWSWGYSEIRKAIKSFVEIDSFKISTVGHSRLGKTALWAAAEDTEFAMAVSIQSGLNGAKLSRRCFGARIEHCLEKYPFWLVPNVKDFIGKETELPVDQHELLGLLAPRPVYVASANDDWWCDPKGEYLSCVAAKPVYDLLGNAEENKSAKNFIGYHVRPGGHSVLPVDWWHILKFAEIHLKK